ncbi:MAG: site-2 protease family protein, partial [Phormidesmis sp.]
MIIVLLLLAAIAILAWGYSKAKPLGRLGIIAWLQTVVLMGPWLLFFGLTAIGVYLNLAGILLLIVASTGVYIYLGRLLRTEGQAIKGQGTANASQQLSESSSENGSENGSDEAVGEAVSRAIGETETAAEKTAEEAAKEAAEKNLPPIPAEDLAVIEGMFGIDTFFRTKTVPYQEG